MRKLILLTAIMLLVPAVSQAKTLEELLVEKGVITQGEAKSAASAPGTVVYNKGVRWDFSDKKYSGQINTMVHTRYTYLDLDENAGGKNTSSFDVVQARIIASGTVLDKEFTYKVEGDFVGSSDASGAKSPFLKDAYISWHACDWADIRMGQWKTGISRQFVTSEQNMQFPDRSAASNYFSFGRQTGIMGNFKAADLPVQISAAMYNGDSAGEGQNRSGVDTRHNAFLNLRWDAMGEMNAFEEGDIDGTEDAALNLGAAYAYSDTGDNHINTVNVDVNFKYQGWGVHGEYYVQDINPEDDGDSVSPQGFYVQVGYFLVPGEFELAARYSLVDCDSGAAGDNGGVTCAGNDSVNAADLSANYFFWRHQLKAQLAYGYENQKPEDNSADDINNNKIIFQVAGYF